LDCPLPVIDGFGLRRFRRQATGETGLGFGPEQLCMLARRAYIPHLNQADCRCRRLQHLQPYRSEEHTSELQSLMRTSYAVFSMKKKNKGSLIRKNKS